MDLDDLDIYDDLDAFHEKEEKKSTELLNLEEKYKESLETIEALRLEIKTLRKQQKTIEVNFQNLLDTAKAELKRKDQQITQLRKEKDDICFRRKHVKPTPGSFHNEEHQHRKSSSTHVNPFSNYALPVPVPEAQQAEFSKEHKKEHLPVEIPAADISNNKRNRSSFDGTNTEKRIDPHKYEQHHKRPRFEEPKATHSHDRSADEHRHIKDHKKDYRSQEQDRHNDKFSNRHDIRYSSEKSRRDPRNLQDNRKSVYRDHKHDVNERETKVGRERERPKDPRDVSDSSRQRGESSNSMEHSTKELPKMFQDRKVMFKDMNHQRNSTNSMNDKESPVSREQNEIKIPKDTDQPGKSTQAISPDNEVGNVTKNIKVESTFQEKSEEVKSIEQKPICSKNEETLKTENKINTPPMTETETVQDIFAKARSITLKSKQSDLENQSLSVPKAESIEKEEFSKTTSITSPKTDENSNHTVVLNTPKKVALFDALFGSSPGVQNDNSKLLTNVMQIFNSDSTSTSPGAFSEANDLETKEDKCLKNVGKMKEVNEITASVVESYFTENKEVVKGEKSPTLNEPAKNADSFFEKVFEELEFDSIPGLSSAKGSTKDTKNLLYKKLESDAEKTDVVDVEVEDDTDIDNTDEENGNNVVPAVESKDDNSDNASNDDKKLKSKVNPTKKASIVIIEDIRLPDVLPIDKLLNPEEVIDEKNSPTNHKSIDVVEKQAENKDTKKLDSSPSPPKANIVKEDEVPAVSTNQSELLRPDEQIDAKVPKSVENVPESPKEIVDNSNVKAEEIPKEVLTVDEKQSVNVNVTITSDKTQIASNEIELQKPEKTAKQDDIQEKLFNLREEAVKIIDKKTFDDNQNVDNKKLLINAKLESEKPATDTKNIEKKNTENQLCDKSSKLESQNNSVETDNHSKNVSTPCENNNIVVKNKIEEKSRPTCSDNLPESTQNIVPSNETSSSVMNMKLDSQVNEQNEKLKKELNTSSEGSQPDAGILKDSAEKKEINSIKSVEVMEVENPISDNSDKQKANIPSKEIASNIIFKDASFRDKDISRGQKSESKPETSVREAEDRKDIFAATEAPLKDKCAAVDESKFDETNELHNSETDSSLGSSTENKSLDNAVSFLKHSFGPLIANERSKKKPPTKLKNFIKLNIPTPKARKRKLQEAKDEDLVNKNCGKEKIRKLEEMFEKDILKRSPETESSDAAKKNPLIIEKTCIKNDEEVKNIQDKEVSSDKEKKTHGKHEKKPKDDRRHNSKHDKEMKDMKTEKTESRSKSMKSKTQKSDKDIPTKNTAKSSGRTAKNARRILDSSSDEEEQNTEPKKSEALANPEEVKQPVPADKAVNVEEKKTENRKIILPNTSSGDSSKHDKSLEIPQREESFTNCSTPPRDHSIFHQDQVNKLAHPLPQFNNLQDRQYKDIDLRLQTMFQSPPYVADKVPVILPPQATDLPATAPPAHETFDEGAQNMNLSTVTIDETLNASSLGEHSSLNDTSGSLETKRISLGKSDYLFEKVSDNVVNVFITRKRHKKNKNKTLVPSTPSLAVGGGGSHPSL